VKGIFSGVNGSGYIFVKYKKTAQDKSDTLILHGAFSYENLIFI